MEITADIGPAIRTARVCSYCETERNESQFLRSYLRVMRVTKVTHGICQPHYQTELLKLKVG